MNEVITDKKDVNNEIFWDYFTYRNPSFLAKYLIRATQAKNEQLVNNINDKIIDLRNAIIMKNTPENENLNKIVDMVEKILNFNTQQKGKGIPSDLACIDLIVKASDHEVFDRMRLKIKLLNKCFKDYQQHLYK